MTFETEEDYQAWLELEEDLDRERAERDKSYIFTYSNYDPNEEVYEVQPFYEMDEKVLDDYHNRTELPF